MSIRLRATSLRDMKKYMMDYREHNKLFYNQKAASFAKTRQHGWVGWDILLSKMDLAKSYQCVDLGCGNGRWALVTKDKLKITKGLGIDNAKELITIAKAQNLTHWQFIEDEVTNVVEHQAIEWSNFNLVVMFGVLHHFFDEKRRSELIRKLLDQIKPGTLLVISLWRGSLMGRKVVKKLETKNDYLISWENDQEITRYCHFFSETEINNFETEMKMWGTVSRFESDGKDSKQNVYLMLVKK